jgi:plasmid stabilization system protein ParE
VRCRVRFHADFQADLRAQLGWLREHRDQAWIERLRVALDEAASLLASFPDVGTVEARDGAVVLRRLIPGKLPYAIWYLRDTSDPEGDIWLLRLFHAKQDRPLPAVSFSPPRAPRRR